MLVEKGPSHKDRIHIPRTNSAHPTDAKDSLWEKVVQYAENTV